MNLGLLRRNREFRLLYIGQFVSFLGTMISMVALPYQVYQETHSTLMVGFLSLSQLLPLLITALLGGVFADHYPRRLLLIGAELLLSVGCLALAFNASLPSPSVIAVFVISMMMSAINGLHRPALDSIVQQIVQPEDFPAVGALSTFKFSISMILGPALGGVLIAIFGIVITYLLDFFSFLISLLALSAMCKLPNPHRSLDHSIWKSLNEGLAYALSRQELIGTYVVDFVAMIFAMPMALFPAIAHGLGGAKTLGFLYSAPAVGALIVSLFSRWTVRIKRHGKAIAIAASLWGVAIILFGLVKNLYWLLFFLALAGGFDAISGIFRSILWNETIPNELRGRLSGIEMLSYLSGPKLGDAEAGIIASLFGITASIVSGGILCVLGVMTCVYFLPKFWTYRANHSSRTNSA